MFGIGMFCLAMGLFSFGLCIGFLLEKPLVKFYDKFDKAMEKAFGLSE